MTTIDPRVCSSCGEPGERKDMAECDNGHFVHDACFPLDDGKCKKCHDPRVEEIAKAATALFISVEDSLRDAIGADITLEIGGKDYTLVEAMKKMTISALTTYGDERYKDGLRRARQVLLDHYWGTLEDRKAMIGFHINAAIKSELEKE